MQQRINALFDRFMGHAPAPTVTKLAPAPSPFFVFLSNMMGHLDDWSAWIVFFILTAVIFSVGRRYGGKIKIWQFSKKNTNNRNYQNQHQNNKQVIEAPKAAKVPCAASKQLAKRAQGIGRSLHPNPRKRDPADVIWANYRDAVVDLFMVFEQPGWFGSSTGLYKGTAWFCSSDGYLVTAGHNTIMPASAGVVNGRLRRAKQIIATVTNLNGQEGKNDALNCRIVNVCGRADVAVLHIKEVTNQKFIRWGNSLNARPGSRLNVIGDPLGQNTQSVASGEIRSNMYFEPSGQQIPESILTTALAFEGNSGSPMLDAHGNALGVYTFGDPTSPGFGGGITERMARPIVEEMIEYDRSLMAERNGTRNPLNKLAKVKTTSRQTWKGHPKGEFPHIDRETGDYKAGYTGLVFNGYTPLERYALGNLGALIGGAVVVDKENPALFPDVQVGDIITQIDDVQIGTLAGQTAPSTGTLLKVAGDEVKLTIYRGKPNTVWQPITLIQKIGVCPPEFEYPLSFVVKKPVVAEDPKLLQRSQASKSKPFLSGPFRISESCELKQNQS